MKPIEGQARQGDVLINRVEVVPTGAKEIRRGRCILALGEATGHAHEVLDAIMYEKDGRHYLKVDEPTEVVHTKARTGKELSGDHGTLTLPPGNYEVVRQEERLGDVWRVVSD